jgi:hypothetical protein
MMVYKKITIALFLLMVTLMCVAQLKLPAFPGAEGHGKYTTGGRGGKVYYVTTLEDNSSVGSLRYAINQTGARLILFKVSGTIQLKSGLTITKGDVTIAGQTAPGDGITLRDFPVSVSADNVIIRFLRFRMGDETDQEADSFGGRYRKNIIIDHCSMSWSTDECVSFYVNENFTLQWCLISESLRNSVHAKGAHGYGGIWGGKNASFHHNLLASHDSRNPRLGESAGDIYALTDLVDLRNNVIYNWQGNSCYGGEGMNVNIVNCYYKPGPATTKTERIVAIDKNKDSSTKIYNMWGKFYIDGNYMSASTRATADNWTYGVYNQYHSSNGTVTQVERDTMRISAPHNPGEVTTHTAIKAYEKVLEFVGASLKRDTIDLRIIHDVSTGTATFMDGGNGSINGIIDSQSAVGGWPVLNSINAPTDTDSDGIPDIWEQANGLNKDNNADAQLKTIDGIYPNIEVYLNSIVSGIVSSQNQDGIPTSSAPVLKQEFKTRVWFNSVSDEINIQSSLKIRKVEAYSINGKLLKSKQTNEDNLIIAAFDLQNGVYIVRVLDTDNNFSSHKIVKF